MITPHHLFAPLSEDIVESFHQSLPKLLVFVNDKFLLENRFQGGRGSSHSETIAEFNHRFSGLLLGVYGFGLYEHLFEEFPNSIAMLIGRGIPAEALGSLLKAWIIGIQCLLRRQVAEQLVPALEHLLSRVAVLAEKAAAPDPPLTGQVQEFFDLLAARNRKFAAEYILSRIRTGTTIEEAYATILLPARERIRLLWLKNRLSAADAATAQDICRYVMFRVVDSVFGERRYPFRALVACMYGEEDVLSAEVFANFLEIKGWSASFLGHDASEDDIVYAVGTSRPQVLVLAIATVAQLYDGRRLLVQLREKFPEVKIVGCGAAVMRSVPYFEPLTDALVTGFEQGHTVMLNLVIPHA